MRAQRKHENMEGKGLLKGEFSEEVKPKASFERSVNTYMQIWGERAFQMPEQHMLIRGVNRCTVLKKTGSQFCWSSYVCEGEGRNKTPGQARVRSLNRTPYWTLKALLGSSLGC